MEANLIVRVLCRDNFKVDVMNTTENFHKTLVKEPVSDKIMKQLVVILTKDIVDHERVPRDSLIFLESYILEHISTATFYLP